MTINILDVAIILILIMFAIIGFKRGAIKEIVSLVGIIAVFIVSFSLKGILGNILCKWLPFFDIGMGWLLPSILGFVIGLSVYKLTKNQNKKIPA